LPPNKIGYFLKETAKTEAKNKNKKRNKKKQQITTKQPKKMGLR